MAGVERSRIDSEKNFLDVLDKVHEISSEAADPTHVFTLSQVYEGLLLKMGEKGNDGGQFFTPREIIRVMIRVVDPQPGKTVYDLKAVNPNRVSEEDTRTPAQLLDFIAEKGCEADAALARLRRLVVQP
jgi:hypothetical protein